MVKLFCSMVGEVGSGFPVNIDENESVGDLKNAIKYQSGGIITCPWPLLELFLAKKDDVWLDRGGAATVALDEHGHPQGFVQMDSLLWIKNVKYFGDNFQPSEGEIHVLVVVPKHLVADPRLLELQESLLEHTLMDPLTSTSARSNYFKTSLIETYQCDMGDEMLRCMLLNTALPSELVIASHLFRRKNEFLSRELMGFADIDDVKNGLLLFKPLKHAFDRFQISFIYEKDTNEFRLKIFDHSLRRKRLFQELDDNECKILLQDQTLPKYWKNDDPDDPPCDSRHMEDRLAGTGFDLRTTFGDVEGQSLCFMSVERPYKRCLNLQARLARKKAIQEAWIQPNEDEFEDFWSEGMSLVEKMAFFSAHDN